MAIFENSRYELVGLYKRSGTVTIRSRFIDRDFPGDSQYYTVVYGDTLDHLAYRFYGDQQLWWIIADANPELSFNLSFLSPGKQIIIPPADPILRKLRERRAR